MLKYLILLALKTACTLNRDREGTKRQKLSVGMWTFQQILIQHNLMGCVLVIRIKINILFSLYCLHSNTI